MNEQLQKLIEEKAEQKFQYLTEGKDDAMYRYKQGATELLSSPDILKAAGLVKESEWIGVEEKLPEYGERVLCSLETGWVELIGILYENGWTCFYSDGQKLAEVNQVTHWQPLPSPPKTNNQ